MKLKEQVAEEITCKWVKFVKGNKRNRKTDIYEIYHKEDDDLFLGYVKWYAPWRQYCFYPEIESPDRIGCIYANSCLTDITNFISKLMSERSK